MINFPNPRCEHIWYVQAGEYPMWGASQKFKHHYAFRTEKERNDLVNVFIRNGVPQYEIYQSHNAFCVCTAYIGSMRL